MHRVGSEFVMFDGYIIGKSIQGESSEDLESWSALNKPSKDWALGYSSPNSFRLVNFPDVVKAHDTTRVWILVSRRLTCATPSSTSCPSCPSSQLAKGADM